MVSTFYNFWNINQAEAFLGQRKALASLSPNEEMGTWVRTNMTFIERAVGKPPADFCKKPRGY